MCSGDGLTNFIRNIVILLMTVGLVYVLWSGINTILQEKNKNRQPPHTCVACDKDPWDAHK